MTLLKEWYLPYKLLLFIDLVLGNLIPDTRFNPDGGWKILFQNNLVSVHVNRYMTVTEETPILSTQLITGVFDIPGGSDFISDKPGNVLLKRLETRSYGILSLSSTILQLFSRRF